MLSPFGWDKGQSLSESGAIPPLPLCLGILPPFSDFPPYKIRQNFIGRETTVGWVGSEDSGFNRSSKYFLHKGLLKFRRLCENGSGINVRCDFLQIKSWT